MCQLNNDGKLGDSNKSFLRKRRKRKKIETMIKRRDMILATRHKTQLNAGKYDEKTQFKLALYSSDGFSHVQFI